MNVLFLSPHFPPNYYLFCRALRARGLNVLGIGEAPFGELRPELREALVEYVQVPQMEQQYDHLLRATAGLVHRHGRLDRIDSLNEHWMGVEAQLRLDFNVPGQKPTDTAVNRSKMGMKEVFVRHDIPCARGERVSSYSQVREFVELVGYPVIFKPDVGVGAARTFRVSTPRELDEALNTLPHGYVVEEYISGELVSFDGLVDRNGVVVFCIAHEFSAGIMDVVNERLPLSYYSQREIPEQLELLGRRVVTAFDVRERFFHIELFRLADGTYRALEVNLRPPGGFTVDMMNFACDIDLYSLWTQALAGDDLSRWRYERRYHVAHASRRHGRSYALDHDALVRELGGLLVAHGPVPAAFSGAIGDYFYMLRDPQLPPLKQAIALVER